MAERISWLLNIGPSLLKFFKETRAETKKVVWPGQRYVVVATLVVLAIVVAVAAFVMFVDWVLATIFGGLQKTF
jgi:preprotein translocase SecE subunit